MMANGVRAQRFGQVLARGMLLAVTISGCEATSADPYAASWDQYIQVMDDALTRGDLNAAEMARQEAFLAARGSRRWDAMVAVGDASVRLMRSPGASPTLGAEARRIYRWALFRARQQGSLEGVVPSLKTGLLRPDGAHTPRSPGSRRSGRWRRPCSRAAGLTTTPTG